jgi:hypothetical protein
MQEGYQQALMEITELQGFPHLVACFGCLLMIVSCNDVYFKQGSFLVGIAGRTLPHPADGICV